MYNFAEVIDRTHTNALKRIVSVLKKGEITENSV